MSTARRQPMLARAGGAGEGGPNINYCHTATRLTSSGHSKDTHRATNEKYDAIWQQCNGGPHGVGGPGEHACVCACAASNGQRSSTYPPSRCNVVIVPYLYCRYCCMYSSARRCSTASRPLRAATQTRTVSNLLTTFIAMGRDADTTHAPYVATHVQMLGLQLGVSPRSFCRTVPTLPPNEGWQSVQCCIPGAQRRCSMHGIFSRPAMLVPTRAPAPYHYTHHSCTAAAL